MMSKKWRTAAPAEGAGTLLSTVRFETGSEQARYQMLTNRQLKSAGLVVILITSLELSGCGTDPGDRALSGGLLGAGGGGYVLIFAKDIEAAARVRTILNTNPINKRARFVDWSISTDGFKVSRS